MNLRATGLQERLEASRWGRVGITGVLVVTLVCIVATNLPDSHLRRLILSHGTSYLNAIGLDQNWGVFAPDPRRQVIGMQANVDYQQGSPTVWRPPQNGALIGTYRDYRWRKYVEWVTSQDHADLWRPTAKWIARQEDGEGDHPLTVALIKRSYDLPPPGPDASTKRSFSQAPYFTLRLPPKLGGRQ